MKTCGSDAYENSCAMAIFPIEVGCQVFNSTFYTSD